MLLRQQRVLQTWPAIPFLDRTKLPAMQQTSAASEVMEEAPSHPVANGFPAATWKGQRSGRHVRSLQSGWWELLFFFAIMVHRQLGN